MRAAEHANRKPFDLLTEGLSDFRCGANVDVTRTLERVTQGFREALGGRNVTDLNELSPEALRSLAQEMNVLSR